VALETHGTVAPISNTDRWSMPLGPLFVSGYDYNNTRKPDDPEDVIVASMARDALQTVPLRDGGLGAVKLASALATNTVLRGTALVGNTTPSLSGFEAALARAGVTLTPFLQAERVLDKVDFELPYGGAIIPGPDHQRTVQRLEFDLFRYGRKANWAIPTEENNDGYCNHFGIGDIDATKRSAAYELNQAYRFDLAGTPIWITRARCEGGATGGSLRHETQLVIYDPRHPAQTLGDFIVDETGSMFGSRRRGLIDLDFEAKLFGQNLLVSYTPGVGSMMVYDLSQRRFLLPI